MVFTRQQRELGGILMPRKPEEHPADIGIQLAVPVSEQQWNVLRLLRYAGPSPSTGPQAAAIIHELLCTPAEPQP